MPEWPASTPTRCISKGWPFPPQTQELQLDEKWAFVYKKQEQCDPEDQADHTAGDCWDHVALDAEHRLVLGVVFGKRSATKIKNLLETVKEQLKGRVPRLVTSDQLSCYQTVLKLIWPSIPPLERDPRCQKRTRHKQPRHAPDPALNYATVCKQRKNGRVVSVQTKAVFGGAASLAAALNQSSASNAVNTSFVERHNATDRHRNARKARKTYRFSKDWRVHEAVGYFTYYTYNFCWCVRTLAQPIGETKSKPKNSKTKNQPRTPAMAAGLTDHVWELKEWLEYPIGGLSN
jgi:IS1 family transposase